MKSVFVCLALALKCTTLAAQQQPPNLVYDPISGLIVAEHYEIVRAHCSACHSAKLVTQNRLSRDNWQATIRWMQKSQGLWPLGDQEPLILDYLATYYSPLEVSRRPPIPQHLMPESPAN